ncbi:unnamed protein product [Leptidea sinapis]|uniref:C2H2-type domain-containing protein n=1 Tax=Leptidea sinapis TaxID=189913 RepID=A0A5E4QWH6_9NEOP|nr:unnamed protein product [Leptidea sinapis]
MEHKLFIKQEIKVEFEEIEHEVPESFNSREGDDEVNPHSNEDSMQGGVVYIKQELELEVDVEDHETPVTTSKARRKIIKKEKNIKENNEIGQGKSDKRDSDNRIQQITNKKLNEQNFHLKKTKNSYDGDIKTKDGLKIDTNNINTSTHSEDHYERISNIEVNSSTEFTKPENIEASMIEIEIPLIIQPNMNIVSNIILSDNEETDILTNNPLLMSDENKCRACSVCGKTFQCEASLLKHNRIHTGVRPYSCDECGKSFNRSYHLKLHRRIHTGERPYSCKVCGKNFNDVSNLKRHNIIHTGEKLYSCNECGKSFTYVSSLTQHNKIHTGQKVYCKVCGKGFIEKSSLKRHTKLHNAER